MMQASGDLFAFDQVSFVIINNFYSYFFSGNIEILSIRIIKFNIYKTKILSKIRLYIKIIISLIYYSKNLINKNIYIITHRLTTLHGTIGNKISLRSNEILGKIPSPFSFIFIWTLFIFPSKNRFAPYSNSPALYGLKTAVISISSKSYKTPLLGTISKI